MQRLILALIRQSRSHASYNAMYNEITSGSCRKYAGALAREIESRTAALYTRLFDGAQRRPAYRAGPSRSCLRFSLTIC